MGKVFSKASRSSGKVKDHEFDYRYNNTKTLRNNIQALVKSLHETNTSMMNTPARMVEVGESYMAINACMNHGGAGGVSQSTNKRGARCSVVSHPDEGENLSPEVGGGHTKINRQLAKESYNSAQAFSESMRKLKEKDYATYRTGVEADVIKKAEDILSRVDATLTLGKAAEAAANKHATAAKKVDGMESKAAKKGKDVSTNKKYPGAVTARDEAERDATAKKNAFHESYEDLMARTQEFSLQSMDRYLDLNVAYHKEFVRVIDASSSPTKSRSLARGESPAPPTQTQKAKTPENHEPHSQSCKNEPNEDDDEL